MGFHPVIAELLEREQGLLAVWMAREHGCEDGDIKHALSQLRRVHDGVWLSGHAPLTPWQTWRSATLTTPATALSDWSAGAFFGLRDSDRLPTTVKRHGDGGPILYGPSPRRLGTLKVYHSDRVAEDTVVRWGIPVLGPTRTLLDLIGRSGEDASARLVRETLRRNLATPVELQARVALGFGRRGVARLKRYADEYGPLGLTRGRSDAEALAMAVLAAAGAPLPELNVYVAGGEADLVHRRDRLIVELDGPQFHRFPSQDAQKQAGWERSGWVVRRLPTDDVYDRPHLLLAASTDAVTDRERAVAAATRSPADVLERWSRGERDYLGAMTTE